MHFVSEFMNNDVSWRNFLSHNLHPAESKDPDTSNTAAASCATAKFRLSARLANLTPAIKSSSTSSSEHVAALGYIVRSIIVPTVTPFATASSIKPV